MDTLWGHNLADYQEMFSLTQQDLGQTILDVACGPDCFNAEMQQNNQPVVSCDPLFTHDEQHLRKLIKTQFDQALVNIKAQQDKYLWQSTSLEQLAAQRWQNIEVFFNDFSQGKQQNRYIAGQLPKLNFSDGQFDFALCSHFLFGYRAGADEQEHLAAIIELCRVAHEVRIFPLLDNQGEISPLIGTILLTLQQQHLGLEIKEVPYHWQTKGNAMLRIWAQTCSL